MGIAVYIATTAGPVRIERIVGENVPQSNVFVGRDYVPLYPISNAYDNFVAPGGPVAKAFGPFEADSFRLDVSRSIDTGNSWELGAFIAHGLAKAGCLANLDDQVDRSILLTGRVNTDLKIGGVGYIAEKLKSATEFFDCYLDEDLSVTFFIPEGDALVGQISKKPVKMMQVGTTLDVFSQLQLTSLIINDSKTVPPENLSRKSYIGKVLFAFLCSILFLGILLGGGFLKTDWEKIFLNYFQIKKKSENKDLPVKKLVKEKILKQTKIKVSQSKSLPLKTHSSLAAVMVYERRPPKGLSCAGIHFFRYEAIETVVETVKPGVLKTSIADNLCGLRIKVQPSNQLKRGIVKVSILQGPLFPSLKMGLPDDGILKIEDNKSWLVDSPIVLQKSVRYTIEAYTESKIDSYSVPVERWSHEVRP